ncbi:MAG: hypothetical protein OXE99_12245 [Cellvibrionales bacterium]|nr:hypothetical protein [Cellvibrionales bacterium]
MSDQNIYKWLIVILLSLNIVTLAASLSHSASTTVSESDIIVWPYYCTEEHPNDKISLDKYIATRSVDINTTINVPTENGSALIGFHVLNTGKYPVKFGLGFQEPGSTSIPIVEPTYVLNPRTTSTFDFDTSKNESDRMRLRYMNNESVANLHNAGVQGTNQYFKGQSIGNKLFMTFMSLHFDTNLLEDTKPLKNIASDSCCYGSDSVPKLSASDFTGAIGYSDIPTKIKTSRVDDPYKSLYKNNSKFRKLVDEEKVSLYDTCIALDLVTNQPDLKNIHKVNFKEKMNSRIYKKNYGPS